MAYNKVYIVQGDYIYYYDTTPGTVVDRTWNLPGGDPSIGTSPNITTRYIVKNPSGYGAGLTATDLIGATDTIFIPSYVSVVSEIENLSIITLTTAGAPIGSPSNVVDMSQNVKFQATGTIRSSATGSYYYQFLIPGTGGAVGFTGTSKQNISVTKKIFDWGDLTGSESGSTYSPYTASAILTVTSPTGNLYSASTSVTYNKSGITDFLNLADYPAANSTTPHKTQRFLSAVVLPYDFVSTTNVGMAGYGPIICVNLLQPGGSGMSNLSFHSQGEPIYYYSPFFEFSYPGLTPGMLTGQTISSGSILTTLEPYSGSGLIKLTIYQWDNSTFGYVPTDLSVSPFNISGLTRYSVGNYMYPGDIYSSVLGYKFYYADTNNQIPLDPYYQEDNPPDDNRYWSSYAITNYINDTSFACLTSRGYESTTTRLTPAATLLLNGGESLLNTSVGYDSKLPFRMGGVLPSGKWAQSNIILTFTFYFNNSRSFTPQVIKSVNITVGASGATGNSYDGNLMYANNRPTNMGVPPHGVTGGFVDIINSKLATTAPTSGGVTGGVNLKYYFGATAAPEYQWRETAYASTVGAAEPACWYVQGVKFSIYEDYINTAKGGSPNPYGVANGYYLVKVLITDNSASWFPGTTGPKYTAVDWMGLGQSTIANPYQYTVGGTSARRGWYFPG